ncbi:MAG TPA: LysR family transcriptional regulator [Acidimicrobiia bacterium]
MDTLPNLSVQQLEYLVAVAGASTWADAAQRVGVTQSALSQGLAELERRVGVVLFERQGRRRVLSAGAAPVLEHAEAVVARTRDLARWAARRRAGETGTLRVGMVDAAAVNYFPRVLRRFFESRPDVELRLTVAPSAPLVEDLARSALDLVVCVEPPGSIDGVEWSSLRTDELAVYAPPHTTVGLPATWGPWVSFPVGSHTRAVLSSALHQLGASFEVVAESHQPEVLRAMVVLGMGWTVLPVAQAGTLERARAEPLAARRLVVARRIAAAPNPIADAMAGALGAARSTM